MRAPVRTRSAPKHLLLLIAAVAGLLASCDGGRVAELESVNATLRDDVAQMEDQLQEATDAFGEERAVLTARVAQLESEVEDLRTTEEALWAAAVAQHAAGALDEAEATLARLVERYPDGARRASADQLVSELDDERASRLVGEATWYLGDGQVGNARTLFVRVVEEFPASASVAAAEAGLRAVEERAAQQAAIDAGFSIEEVETFWSRNVDGLAGRALYQPELRLYVRPSSTRALEYLQLRAVFFELGDDVVEEFGDATEYLVGAGDLPLEPGVRKQARMRSSVGFVENWATELRFARGDAPSMRVDLYFKTGYSEPWQRFYSAGVSTDFRY